MVHKILSLILLLHCILHCEMKNHTKMPNSKYLDPQLDDEENIQIITQDFPVSEQSQDISDSNRKGRSDSNELGPSSTFGHTELKNLGLADFLLPALGVPAPSYAAQYYGIAPNNWRLSFLNYPSYVYRNKYKNTRSMSANLL